MEITYYGHATFMVDIAGKKLLFDPFISPNPLAKSVDLRTIKADYILLSHAHQDHVADVEMLAKQTGAQLISNFEIITYYQNKGLSNGWPMNHGGNKAFDFGSVKMVNAIHTSSFADGTYGGNPAGFVIQGAGQTFYYAGDTALTLDMKLIGEEFDVDFAFLPIGDNFTMGLKDALKAAEFVDTNTIIGMHYDTFPPIEVNAEDANAQAAAANKSLTLLSIGETISL